MAFVRGHPRDATWVVAHFRRPQEPDDGQLALTWPEPRRPADDEPGDHTGDQADDEAGDPIDADRGGGLGSGPPDS